MHTKTWIIDGAVAYTGSVNMTHNGLENNIEHLWKIQEEGALRPLREEFAAQWETLEIVKQQHIDRMHSIDTERKEKTRLKPTNRNQPDAIRGARASLVQVKTGQLVRSARERMAARSAILLIRPTSGAIQLAWANIIDWAEHFCPDSAYLPFAFPHKFGRVSCGDDSTNLTISERTDAPLNKEKRKRQEKKGSTSAWTV